MSKPKASDRKLTLREAFDTLYDKSELSTATVRWYGYTLNKWEAVTTNPPVDKIDNETLAAFRQACLDGGTSGQTVNHYWTSLRAILRRIGPQFTGNPLGLGIIERVPYMKRVRVPRKPPARVPLEHLDKFFISCKSAQYPRMAAYPPAWWWQCLLVIAFYTALRKSDLFAIRRENIDLESATLYVESQKTMKADEFPLPAVAIEHIRRLWEPERESLFLMNGSNLWGGAFDSRWRAICEHAGIPAFTLKSIRSTAASEAEKVRPGAASMLLQHARHDVTGRHYLSLSDVLRDVVDQMPVPLAFKHGINLDEKAHERKQKEIVRMMPREFATPRKPDPSEWRFEPDSVCFRGEWFSCRGAAWRALNVLAEADGPVDVFTLADAIFGNYKWPREFYRVTGRVGNVMSVLRDKLRRVLRCSDEWNPVVCTERGAGGKWTLLFPPDTKGGTA